MTAYRPIAAARLMPAVPDAWRRPLLAYAAVAALLLALFAKDAAAMATIWWTSSTFSHCLLILPIIGWLVWQRRVELAGLTPAASPWGLAIVGIGALGWLLGEAAGVALGRHLGLVLMLQGAVVAVFGIAVVRGLLFPLCYALFLVPFGEEFVPMLQTLTAELSMALLGLFGVPAHIEGVFITTPTGYFEVAEACSGVKFLIAMIALGALAANLCFRSWPRRIAFMAACIAVPILANGMRAFATIYIAERSGMHFAESFDHVVYGWFFFAFVIALLLAMGWRFFDREIDEPAFDPRAIEPVSPARPRGPGPLAAAVLAIALVPLAWTAAISATGRAPIPELALPRVAGWQQSDAPMAYPWAARFAGADRLAAGRYTDGDGAVVDLAIAYYGWQEEGKELVGFGQGGHPADTEWSWVEDAAPLAGGRAYRIAAPGPVTREVVQLYLVGDTLTGSDGRAKIATLRRRLLGGDQRAIGVVVSAEGPGARQAVEAFLRAAGPVDRLVDRAAGMPD